MVAGHNVRIRGRGGLQDEDVFVSSKTSFMHRRTTIKAVDGTALIEVSRKHGLFGTQHSLRNPQTGEVTGTVSQRFGSDGRLLPKFELYFGKQAGLPEALLLTLHGSAVAWRWAVYDKRGHCVAWAGHLPDVCEIDHVPGVDIALVLGLVVLLVERRHEAKQTTLPCAKQERSWI
jgi:hypothetical protein